MESELVQQNVKLLAGLLVLKLDLEKVVELAPKMGGSLILGYLWEPLWVFELETSWSSDWCVLVGSRELVQFVVASLEVLVWLFVGQLGFEFDILLVRLLV